MTGANPSASRVLIAVLGMHRAGTSLLANLLCEVTGETDGSYLPGNEFNAKGYWEDVEVVTIHNRVLTKMKREWGSIRSSFPYPAGWWKQELISAEREELKAVIDARTGAAAMLDQPWVVKDPRMSRLFPLWREIARELGIEVRAVLALRHPDAVAMSLGKRDGFHPTLSHALWLLHYVDAVLDAGPHVRLVVPYDDWFETPRETLRTMIAHLGLSSVDDNRIESLSASVIDPALRHHHDEDSLPPLLQLLLDQLRAWPAGAPVPALLKETASNVRETLDAFRSWQIATDDDHYFDEARKIELERLRQAGNSQVEHIQALLKETREQLRTERSEHVRAGRTIEARDLQIADLHAEVTASQQTLSELRDELSKTKQDMTKQVFLLEEELSAAKELIRRFSAPESPLLRKLAFVLRRHFKKNDENG